MTTVGVRDAVSAGGVVWRRGEGDLIQIVLCGRRSEALWGLPKGTPEPGETIEQTALREVREETGLEVQMGERVGTIEYWFTAGGVRYHKLVHHWLMEPIGGDVSGHDHEFDDVEWIEIGEAKTHATYENERKMIAEADRIIRSSM
ncbi:MAG TPA: NUDIX hydrolase [Tepidiformaceae bacterium]